MRRVRVDFGWGLFFVAATQKLRERHRAWHSFLPDARPFVDEPVLVRLVQLVERYRANVVRSDLHVPEILIPRSAFECGHGPFLAGC
jgi:hypothetical protein